MVERSISAREYELRHNSSGDYCYCCIALLHKQWCVWCVSNFKDMIFGDVCGFRKHKLLHIGKIGLHLGLRLLFDALLLLGKLLGILLDLKLLLAVVVVVVVVFVFVVVVVITSTKELITCIAIVVVVITEESSFALWLGSQLEPLFILIRKWVREELIFIGLSITGTVDELLIVIVIAGTINKLIIANIVVLIAG
jgi:hypothetical protein